MRFLVLVVEDDKTFAKLISLYLSQDKTFSHEAIYCESLASVQKLVSERVFDCVLLDLNLVDSHGRATFDRVVAICPDTPILVISGIVQDEEGFEYVKFHADAFIPKGLLDQGLTKMIKLAIENRAALKEAKTIHPADIARLEELKERANKQ